MSDEWVVKKSCSVCGNHLWYLYEIEGETHAVCVHLENNGEEWHEENKLMSPEAED